MQMRKLASVLFFLSLSTLVHGQADILTRIEKKEAARLYAGVTEMKIMDLSGGKLSFDSLLRKGDQVIQILQEGAVAGYILRSSAMGRYERFDYSVFYDPGLSILGVRVTAYRSTHGAAICQRKWLSQFNGYDGGELVLGKDIDAISGASISAHSMVADMKRCFILMDRLQEDGWLQ
jgi:hypothetical protein